MVGLRLEHARRPGARSRARELLARAVQHETDHLDGVLFVDRLDAEARAAALAEIEAGRVGGHGRLPAGAEPVVKVSPH